MAKSIKSLVFEIGRVYKVATALCMAVPAELTARFGIGNKMFQVKQQVESKGQNMPSGAQIMTADEQAKHPGKLLWITEGLGRLAIAEALGTDLEVLIHSVYTDRQIFERNVSANGVKSDLSVMDINSIILRGLKLGLTEDELRVELAFVAGRGQSSLAPQRYLQYSRLHMLPAEVQMMAHDGLMRPDSVLHMTNAKRTPEQFERVVADAVDTRKRLAHEQWERDVIYRKRESDDRLKAIMDGAADPEPDYTKKTRVGTRAKGEVSKQEPLTTDEIKASEEKLGMQGKNKHKVDPTEVNPLSTDELIHAATQLRERGGIMIEVGDLLEALVVRKISEVEYCNGIEAIFKNGSGGAKRARRELVEKIAKNGPAKNVPELVMKE